MSKNTTIYKRIKGGSQFVTVPNDAIQNKNLSWKARGLLAYLLSLPKDWTLVKGWLPSQSNKDGRDSTNSAFDELVDAGYIFVHYVPATSKRPPTNMYAVFNSPIDLKNQEVKSKGNGKVMVDTCENI